MKSDDSEKDGPRRSKRSREPPERLNPTMMGQSYAIRKKNIEIKRKMKKDIKMLSWVLLITDYCLEGAVISNYRNYGNY